MVGMNAGEIAAHAVQAVVVVCLFAAVYNGALAWPTDRHLALFASVYEVPVTPANRRLLARYIWWSRVWRIGGGVTALVVCRVATAIADVPFDQPLTVLAVGYALGAVIGEAVRPRPPRATGARASLEVRRVTSYVRPWLPVSTVALWIGSIVALVLAHWADGSGSARLTELHFDLAVGSWSEPALVSAIGVASAVIAVSWVVATRLARRPQPEEAPDIEAVHHAIRSAAIMSLMGCALMASATSAAIASERLNQMTDRASWPEDLLIQVLQYGALIGSFTGLMLSWRAIPRFAPFWRRLPAVPPEPA